MKNIKKIKKQIIISSGLGNFHMLHTSSVLFKHNRLNRVLCGLYPSNLDKKILLFIPLSNNKKKNFYLEKKK